MIKTRRICLCRRRPKLALRNVTISCSASHINYLIEVNGSYCKYNSSTHTILITTNRNYIAVKQSNICILSCSSVYSNTRTRIYIVEIVGNIILLHVQLRSEYLQVSDRAHEHSCGNVNSSLSRDHHVTLFVTTLLSFPQCCRTILCF